MGSRLLSHLLGCGVRLETHEAIALARELLAHPCGIPTLENIQLCSDGSASCLAADGVPSVMSIADLLLMLLPHGTPGVPAPLRLAIAPGRYPTSDEFVALVEGLRRANVAGPLGVDDIRSVVPGIAASKLRVMLMALKQVGAIAERRGVRYEIRPALRSASVGSLAAAYEDRRQRDHRKLEQMVVYAQTALCRTRILLEALGEDVDWSECGACDNCRGVSIRPEASALGAA